VFFYRRIIVSIVQKIRGLFGLKLLENVAGYRVVRSSSGISPWVREGESLALIPEGIQEIQFPVDVMGSDSIAALIQISVVFVYTNDAEKYFNFAYNVASSSHTGDFVSTTKKLIMNALASEVANAMRGLAIAEMVKETTFKTISCDGVSIKSILLSVKPRDSQVIAALGANKTEELVRLANTARQSTRMQAIDDASELRTREHEEALEANSEESMLIAERAKNQLAEAEATAAAQEVLSGQVAKSAESMVAAFGGDPMAYAINQLANSGGDVTVTTELLAALRRKK
jgi:methyl-accepting chemotaxis protein